MIRSSLLACFIAAASSAAEPDAIRAAVAKSLPLLEAAARGSLEERDQCFTCHNQGLPIMALTTARARGFAIDEEKLRTQLQFTADSLAKNREKYLAGIGQGGKADTAGYALWALANGGWKPDETTEAVVEFLTGTQRELVHWKPQSDRPPTEQSLFTSTHVALRGMKTFGTPAQRERIEQRIAAVREWLLETPARDTEDRASRLRALHVIGAETSAAAKDLLATQRDDGGWSQLADMTTDAYATATALVALHQAGALATSDAAYQRGLGFLLAAQLPDGSWHVRTRSKPIQRYYESGYPHGKDQFISVSAAGWATTALALALPLPERSSP